MILKSTFCICLKRNHMEKLVETCQILNICYHMIFQMRLDFVEGGMWHVVVGEAFSQDVTFEVYCFQLHWQLHIYSWLWHFRIWTNTKTKQRVSCQGSFAILQCFILFQIFVSLLFQLLFKFCKWLFLFCCWWGRHSVRTSMAFCSLS